MIIFAAKSPFVRRFLLALLILTSGTAGAQTCIFGRVTNQSGEPLEFVNVVLKDNEAGTATDQNGEYRLNIASGKSVYVSFSMIGYQTRWEQVMLADGQQRRLDVDLVATSQELEQVTVEDVQVRKSTLTRLNPKVMGVLPDASGSIESLIKTMPGVAANNELSSQYSVRGGSFDENLVYVNGIEVYRPFLVRSGEQEGLSFVNSDMVSSLLFSAGGFDAKYGDKMSSVLDIKYKRPAGWGGTASGSLFGGSVMLHGDSFNHRFHHISGIRYKTTKYLLNSLETSGDYDPKFVDFQTYLSFDLTSRIELGFLGNCSSNVYNFLPHNRRTKFGLFNQPMELRMFFEGREKDAFRTYTGALSADFKVNDGFSLKLTASAFTTHESETYDILSEYFINEIDNAIGASSYGDSVNTVGIGAFLNHGRNYLDAKVMSVEHKGMFSSGNHFLNWGLSAQRQQIDDNLSEWTMIDSAGYSRPHSETAVNMSYSLRARNSVKSNRLQAYVQDVFQFMLDSSEMHLTVGLRANYWTFNSELLVSPRVSLSYKPNWRRDVVFKLSGGYYYQSPFYKEMRMTDGQINNDIRAQKSLHFVAGADWNFTAWNRPFKFITELYYKKMTDLISYQIDNLRTIYSGRNDADGYAVGLDMKINGEFVKGVDSWFSLSLMQTEEDIRDDVWVRTDADGNEYTTYPGYIPRPTDQRLNISMFFQDYFPGNPDYKVHLQINYGSRLPFGPPQSPRYMATGRMSSYQRVDLGFSKSLKNSEKTYSKSNPFYYVKEAWICAEVLNVIDRRNVASFEWVTDYANRQYAVENSLTGRRFNVKLSVNF